MILLWGAGDTWTFTHLKIKLGYVLFNVFFFQVLYFGCESFKLWVSFPTPHWLSFWWAGVFKYLWNPSCQSFHLGVVFLPSQLWNLCISQYLKDLIMYFHLPILFLSYHRVIFFFDVQFNFKEQCLTTTTKIRIENDPLPPILPCGIPWRLHLAPSLDPWKPPICPAWL